MTLKLVVKSEASWGREELLLSGNSHGVGRLHDNDLSIQVDCVSGYHAELKRTPDGGYAIIDLKSTNGTFLNGNRVTAPERVKPGDHLKFGNVLVAVEEKIEVLAWPQKESLPGDGPSKVVSLKDLFGFESDDHFNTYPITPIRPAQAQVPAPVMANGGGAPLQPVKMAPPAPTPAMAAQQVERVHQLERAQQLERAREAERVRQLEKAREAERVRQIEQAREAERVRQIEQAREAERVRQVEAAREAERLRQVEAAREAERLRQIEQAREAERVRQLEAAKEAERLRQIEQAREAERVRQLEVAKEAERLRQIEQAREAERARQLEQAQEAERAQQLERAREAERARQMELAREAERLRQIEAARQAERAAVTGLAEVNLQKETEPPVGMDFGSAIHSLTTQLESAMREISRLKASLPDESPRAVVMNGHGALPDQVHAVAQGHSEQATPLPGNIAENAMPAASDRDHREGEGKEGRVTVHTPPPLQNWNPENERVFEDLGKLPNHSVVHPPERVGAARSIWRMICRR